MWKQLWQHCTVKKLTVDVLGSWWHVIMVAGDVDDVARITDRLHIRRIVFHYFWSFVAFMQKIYLFKKKKIITVTGTRSIVYGKLSHCQAIE